MVRIVKLDSEAVGVGKLEDRTILIDKVLVDEEVEILDKIDCGKYDVALDFVVTAGSMERVEPLCQYYNECGGCQLQHATTYYQKEFKINKVKDAFKYIANTDIKIDEFINSLNQYMYRNNRKTFLTAKMTSIPFWISPIEQLKG